MLSSQVHEDTAVMAPESRRENYAGRVTDQEDMVADPEVPLRNMAAENRIIASNQCGETQSTGTC